MLWPGLGEQLWPARAAASEQEIKLGVNWRKERGEFITEIRKIPHGKLSLSPFSWWILCVQRTKFWNSEGKNLTNSKLPHSGAHWEVLHAPENPHCTANEGSLRAANLQSTQWYLCRGGTKAVPLRDSFNMIQRKRDELQQGLGNSPFLFL